MKSQIKILILGLIIGFCIGIIVGCWYCESIMYEAIMQQKVKQILAIPY
jgi:ABC-type nitrate/sulfonate/bicarbonate transport system permease component